MKIGPKYKIARRLGAPIFEKTQTQKYALSLSKKEKNGKVPDRPKSEFGKQLQEKQKARFTYGLTERQFKNYVKASLIKGTPTENLYSSLELRLDNVLYRSGFARTRSEGRQMASHGHALVNGRRVTIPSIRMKEGDAIEVREGSKKSVLFEGALERMKERQAPEWLEVKGLTAKVIGTPRYTPQENVFDLSVVLEFYSR